jgi:hypothetical protein
VERYRSAMEEALALGPERTAQAEIYADLALHGYGRPYMWRQPPAAEIAAGWLEAALDLADPQTEARGVALLARALGAPQETGAASAAAEVLSISEALGNAWLEVHAYEAHALIASGGGRFQEACAWAERELEALPRLTDPGIRAHQYWHAAFAYLRGGRIADVPTIADTVESLAASLTPHDEVHALALRSLLQSSTGRWQELSQLTGRAETAAHANEDTPCQFNWRTLLVCALGHAQRGDESEARRLEERARAGAFVAGPVEREPALLRLAILRGDLEQADRILEHLPRGGDAWGLDAAAARIDALVALSDRERVEEEASAFLEEESYTRPFALRALGIVRDDEALIEQAAAVFEAMGLAWRAAETRGYLATIH